MGRMWRLAPAGTPPGRSRTRGANAARVLLIGLEELHDDCWAVLVDAGISLERADDVAGAVRALIARPIPVVIAGAPWAESLMPAVRRLRERASTQLS